MKKLLFSMVSTVTLGGLVIVGCSDDGEGKIEPTGGSPSVGGGGGSGGSGGGSGGAPLGGMGGGAGAAGEGPGPIAPEGDVALPFNDGWLDADANALGIQGAIFGYADVHTIETMSENIASNGGKACIQGEAFRVEIPCEITDPNATDCYGEYWGAAIGLNLNQPKVPDPDTGESVGGTPEPFDASGISAFSFKLDGPTIPTTLRFSVDGGDGVQYCTTKETKLMPLPADGVLTVKLDDLRAKCWESTAFANNDAPDRSSIVKIAWAVVTDDKSAKPFDFCVSEIVAVP